MIFLFALLWFAAGFAVAAFLSMLFNLPLGIFQWGLIGVVMGLLALLPIVSTKRGRHIFSRGRSQMRTVTH